MKFFYRHETTDRKVSGMYQWAHIARDNGDDTLKSLCACTLKLEKWTLVESLPEGTHLCKNCRQLANYQH